MTVGTRDTALGTIRRTGPTVDGSVERAPFAYDGTVEERAVARMTAIMGAGMEERRFRTLEFLMAVAVVLLVFFGSAAVIVLARGGPSLAPPLYAMGACAAAMIGIGIDLAIRVGARRRARASAKADAGIVLSGLREGRIVSLSLETTQHLRDLVGFRAIAEAVHSCDVLEEGPASRTRADLGAAAGLSESTVGRLENGLRVSVATRERVAEAVGDGPRSAVARARLEALLDLGEPSLDGWKGLMFMAGSVPHSRIVFSALTATFVLMDAVFMWIWLSGGVPEGRPWIPVVVVTFGVILSTAVAWTAFAAAPFMREFVPERDRRCRLVLAGIRDGTIRYVSGHALRIVRTTLGDDAVAEAIDAAHPDFHVDCLGDRDAFAGGRS